jgi:signal transduction histidine kinase/ActR/RegA family two-component response regulator
MPVSIRSRLLLLMLSVLVPAVAAALWVIFLTYRSEQAASERSLRETTRAMAMVVDRELHQRATIARVLSITRALDNAPRLSAEDLRTFELQARRAMEGLAGWVELRSAEGLLLSTRRSQGPAPDPAAAGPSSNAGTARAAAPALVSVPMAEPLLDRGDGAGLHAALLQPVLREDEPVLNVVVTLLPHELQGLLDKQRTPPGWLGTVMDDRSVVVARQPGGSRYTGRLATEDLRTKMREQKEAMFESVSLDGHPTTGYFSTSPQGWVTVGAMPRNSLAGIPRGAWKLGLGALALLLLAMAGALWVTQHIVAPVQSLRRAAQRLRAGEPVDERSTGITEVDQVNAALAEAGQSIREASAELGRQVAAAVRRTREAEQRASQSQRVEALGRLTGGVAHDFNNLLGVISNSAHLIQRLQPDTAVRAPVEATLRAVEVGSRLTRQLLRFAGRQPLQPQRVALTQYLPEVQDLMQTVLGKRIEVTARVSPDTHAVTVDPSELELALINVCLNARDAMPAGGHLWLQARNAEADERTAPSPAEQVLITLTDDGQGIDEALIERVFEPFFTTKPIGQGTGLGLSQVHGFCVQAGGTARLASTPGLGTTVTLVLPAERSDVLVSKPPWPPLSAQACATDDLAGRRVLLVEDNNELAAVSAALLVTYGCEVRRARDPQEALHLIETEAGFDIVLSDIVMPGEMDGLALARRLHEHLPGLPVVLISGYSAALQATREFTVLAKPATPEQLLNALRTALQAAETLPEPLPAQAA